MTASYTFDVFSSHDGFRRRWWQLDRLRGNQGPELLALYRDELRMVFGANTYRAFAHILAPAPRTPRHTMHGSHG
jgi:hypothetical protein